MPKSSVSIPIILAVQFECALVFSCLTSNNTIIGAIVTIQLLLDDTASQWCPGWCPSDPVHLAGSFPSVSV